VKILYVNEIDGAILTPSTENTQFKFETAFADKRLTRFGTFTGFANENLKFYKDSGIPFCEVLVANNNFSESAIVVFEANIEDVWTSPQVSVALQRQTNGYYYYSFANEIAPTANNYADELGNTYSDESGNIYADYDKEKYIYCRITVQDPTNTTPLKIAKIFVGTNIVLPGIDSGTELPINSNSVYIQGQGGQIFSDKRIQYKTAKASFPAITEAQRKNILAFFSVVDITEPFYLLVWENDLDVEPPLYCSLTKDLNIRKMSNQVFTLDFEFIENK